MAEEMEGGIIDRTSGQLPLYSLLNNQHALAAALKQSHSFFLEACWLAVRPAHLQLTTNGSVKVRGRDRGRSIR